MELHERTAKYLKGYFGESRRLDQITRFDARDFKPPLAQGEMAKFNERKFDKLSPHTVAQHVRTARTMFNRAVDDDLILYNPFDRLTGGLAPIQKEWHYVSLDEFEKLLAACNCTGWKVLLGLCRLAGLRQGEALALRWRDVDLAKKPSHGMGGKTQKTKRSPIVPELVPLIQI